MFVERIAQNEQNVNNNNVTEINQENIQNNIKNKNYDNDDLTI